jgi:dTDP-4-dehydrorhamnose reductase
MRIVLLGKNGQLGWECQRSLSPLGELIALDRHSANACGDLSQLQNLEDSLISLQPDVIVNAAAFTAVDQAETESELAFLINAEAPKGLARTALKLNALMVHYSTDYVFNGSGSKPWRENDATAPLNGYGHSKLAGEQAIVASGCRHLIFRTSWVYATRGNNFAKTMLRLAQQRDQLSVIDDQIGAPTSAELIADVSAHAIKQTLTQSTSQGLYHLSASGETSWYHYAKMVLAQARLQGIALKAGPEAVQAIPTSAYPTSAQRPLNSRLDVTKLETTFNLTMPTWQTGVERMLTEVLASSNT